MRGFIALFSAIIISAALLAAAVSAGAAGFSSRQSAANAYYKSVSKTLAEACIQHAILSLSENASYAPISGGDSVLVGNNTCTILSVETLSSASNSKTVRIETSGSYGKAHTFLIADVSIPNAFSSGSVEILDEREVSTP